MDLIYLDYNCFQREFDDPGQIRIQLEAFACQAIFEMAYHDDVELIWSFMHQDESLLCPFIERKIEATRLSSLCKHWIGPQKKIYDLAKAFTTEKSLSAKDSIHLACAVYAHADYFITCDDRLLKQARKLPLEISIMNPVEYIRKDVI